MTIPNYGDVYDDIHPHVMNYEHNDHYLEVSNLIELNAVINVNWIGIKKYLLDKITQSKIRRIVKIVFTNNIFIHLGFLRLVLAHV